MGKESADHQDVQEGAPCLADHVHNHAPKAAAIGMQEEQPDENIQLFPCSLCGRTFRKEALEMHANICQQVFLSERDVYIPQDVIRELTRLGVGRAAGRWEFCLGETKEVEKKPEA